jgi:hypothetical protein
MPSSGEYRSPTTRSLRSRALRVARDRVVAEYDIGYFTAAIDRAFLQIRWYETDDFNAHYAKRYNDGDRWECRSDRHQNSHNARSHFHPPRDATTPGTDAEYTWGWLNVLSRILEDIDDRIEAFWD